MSNIELNPGMKIETKTMGEYELQVDDHIVGDDLIYRVTRPAERGLRAVPVWSQSDDRPVSGREERPPRSEGPGLYYQVITVVR